MEQILSVLRTREIINDVVQELNFAVDQNRLGTWYNVTMTRGELTKDKISWISRDYVVERYGRRIAHINDVQFHQEPNDNIIVITGNVEYDDDFVERGECIYFSPIISPKIFALHDFITYSWRNLFPIEDIKPYKRTD